MLIVWAETAVASARTAAVMLNFICGPRNAPYMQIVTAERASKRIVDREMPRVRERDAFTGKVWQLSRHVEWIWP